VSETTVNGKNFSLCHCLSPSVLQDCRHATPHQCKHTHIHVLHSTG